MKTFVRKSPLVSVTLAVAAFVVAGLVAVAMRASSTRPAARDMSAANAALPIEGGPSVVSPKPSEPSERPASRAAIPPAHEPEPAPGRWEAETERTLRGLAERMEPSAHLTSLKCVPGSCRVEVRHEPSEAAGNSLNAFIAGAMDILPDSVTESGLTPGQTRITLSRGSEPPRKAPPANDALPPKPLLDVR